MAHEFELEKIAIAKGIEVPEDMLEEEIYMLNVQAAHNRQYANLSGQLSMQELMASSANADEAIEQLKAQALMNLRVDLLLAKTIEEQDFELTTEELEAEAEAMAKRQNTSVDMIKSFFGEDLSGLRRDLLERKATAYLLGA